MTLKHRAPRAGRKPLSRRGKTQDIRLTLRPDEIAWLLAEAERRGFKSRSRLVSAWIERRRARAPR